MGAQQLESRLAIIEDFTAEYLEQYGILPIEIDSGVLKVAVAGAPQPEVLRDLEQFFSAPAELLTVDAESLRDAIRRTFAAGESVVEMVKDLGAMVGHNPGRPDDNVADARDLANQPPVIRFVNVLIREANEARASDVHLEATERGLRVRFRIDGVLSELPSPPVGIQDAVVSRLKLLAELDIAERRAPQDGRIRVRLEARELDLRISTVPTLHGESVVLRLLDRGGKPITLDSLGLGQAELSRFQRLAGRSHGILLATGPTGSGKTTTLYAALGLRDPAAEKIITVEDPVEYRLPGITQVPVHAAAGVTFGGALRSILRQDPDVLMIGEMRDRETAAIAIQAAMTGHLVFSTLHTNDAVSALTRLADLGVESYLIAATVEAVLAQRLVRRICPHCAGPYRPDREVLTMLATRELPSNHPGFVRGLGCDQCRETGFLGRTGVYELLVVNDEIRAELSGAPNAIRLRELAKRDGMTTLREDGWRKVLAGVTTAEEVLRVLGE